jgi:hypothetical protein
MTTLVERLKAEPRINWVPRLAKTSSIELNYRWELKGDRLRSFIELTAGGLYIRTAASTRIIFNPDDAYARLEKEAKAVKDYVKDLGRTDSVMLINHKLYKFDPDFKGYYLKGEKQEKFFGSLLD